jgi:predicted MFS family arabinose efflux permease
MTLYLILAIAVLNQTAFGGCRVAVSLYGIELGASQFTIGILVSLFAILPMLLGVTIGRFVDRTAPQMTMIMGSVVMIVALMLPPLFPGLGVLCVTAALLGLSHPLFLIPMEATLGGVGGGNQRVRNYSVLAMGWSFANFLGPVIAGFSIDHIGHRPVFLVLAAITVVPTIMLCVLPGLLPRSAQHGATDAHGRILDLWNLPPIRTTLITSAIVGSGMDLFQFYFPIYGHSVGLSASSIGTIIGVVSVSAFIVRGMLPLLVRRYSEIQALTFSIFIAAVAFVLLPMFSNAYALAATAFVLGLSVGCATPMTMSLLYVQTPPARIAEAIGLQKMIRNATQLSIPLIFGSVGTAFGFTTVFLSCAAMLSAGGALVLRNVVPHTDHAKK